MRTSRMLRMMAVVALVVVLVLVVVPVTQADEEPNIIIGLPIPPNDNFADAADLVLNLRAKTTGLLGFAGLEPLETTDPDLTSCVMYHTVWYKFTAPFGGYLAFSTAGSLVYSQPDRLETMTRMAVYSGTTLANLVERACAFDDASGIASIYSLAVTPGTTYYVRVGSGYSGIFGGVYKVRAVILDATNWDPVGVLDGSFEAPITGLNWVIKKAYNGDGRDCTTGYMGSCSFKFVGGIDESTKIQQVLPWPIDVLVGHEAHRLELYSYYKAPVIADLKMKLCISYSDGTPTTKASVPYSTVSAGYIWGKVGAAFESPNVSAVKVMFKNKAAGGVLNLDYINIDYDGGLLRSVPVDTLPVPPAAQ